ATKSKCFRGSLRSMTSNGPGPREKQLPCGPAPQNPAACPAAATEPRLFVNQVLRPPLLEFFEIILPQCVNLVEGFVGFDSVQRRLMQEEVFDFVRMKIIGIETIKRSRHLQAHVHHIAMVAVVQHDVNAAAIGALMHAVSRFKANRDETYTR